MCSSHQPENGADSEYPTIEGVEHEPMAELPRAPREMVEQYVREAKPLLSPDEHKEAVNDVLMADLLGRAIHLAKRVGGPWGPPCVRTCGVHGRLEAVPYSYTDPSDEGVCLCESMALHLVELMHTIPDPPDLLMVSSPDLPTTRRTQ